MPKRKFVHDTGPSSEFSAYIFHAAHTEACAHRGGNLLGFAEPGPWVLRTCNGILGPGGLREQDPLPGEWIPMGRICVKFLLKSTILL